MELKGLYSSPAYQWSLTITCNGLWIRLKLRAESLETTIWDAELLPKYKERYGALAKVCKKPIGLWSICSELARHVLHANLQIKRTYCTHNPPAFISGWNTAAALTVLADAHLKVKEGEVWGRQRDEHLSRWERKSSVHGIAVTDFLHHPAVRGWAPGREWIPGRDFLTICSPGRAFLLILKINVQCKLGTHPWGHPAWFMFQQAGRLCIV